MPEVDDAIRDMFVGGVSQQRVGSVVEQVTGNPASPSPVSRVFHTLEAEFADWQQRSLPKHYVYAFADGTYFSVIYEGEGQKMPVLALIGIREDGQREVIAFTTGERENQGAWESLLADIKARGVEEVDLWITDGHQAMLNAIALKFPTSKRQRCAKHKMDNILSHVPDKQREAVRAALPLGHCVYGSRLGRLSDLLRLSRGALAEHSHEQYHRAHVRGGQEAQQEDGGRLPQRGQLPAPVLRRRAHITASEDPDARVAILHHY